MIARWMALLIDVVIATSFFYKSLIEFLCHIAQES